MAARSESPYAFLMVDETRRLRAALAPQYTLEQELGRGGMATVWLAQDRKLKRAVAIKVLRADLVSGLAERFLREVAIVAKLSHPHILPLFASGKAAGFLYFVMPYVAGETLRARIDREKQLSLDEVVSIAREVADALEYAHRHDIVHRDVKPENILFDEGHAVVADFGVARAIAAAAPGGALTDAGLAIGTVHYMSPEQAAGERDIDGRADTYALGCVLYEMITGVPPFQGDTAEGVLRQKLIESPRPLSDFRAEVPDTIEAAVCKAL